MTYEAIRKLLSQGDLHLPLRLLWKTHQGVWSATGIVSHGLFGSLPGCGHCLTQIKDRLASYPYHVTLTQEDREWAEELNLADNDLIPQVVDEETVFTREQLEEFSRLQLLANFPKGDVT